MLHRLQRFLSHHPVLRDAILWAIPAILIGGLLRVLLVSYLPYALWGADSRSHFAFANRLLVEHAFFMDEKRRFLYPILMVPLAMLPGVPLKLLAIFQHLLGTVSLVPLAYAVRKTLAAWRVWILPITILYALLPVTILFEHEMVGECLLFNAFLWAFAGWQAWVGTANLQRSQRLFWWFYVAFAAFILTKAAGRFIWPGLALGFLLVPQVRQRVSRGGIIAMIALVVVTPFVGSKKHGSLMLYSATFPLTQLDSPKHAEYKQEVRDMVQGLQQHLDVYYLLDDAPFNFVYRAQVDDSRPHWKDLVQNHPKDRQPLCLDLALEGIKARPLMVLYFGLQRLVASATFPETIYAPFTGAYFRQRGELFYQETERIENNGLRLAMALPPHGPLPPYEEVAKRFEPVPDTWQSHFVPSVIQFMSRFDLVQLPTKLPVYEQTISKARPTFWGWLFLAGAVVSFLPRYRATLGAWTLASASYLYLVFVFSEVNYRYFAPAWPVVLLLMVLPVDALIAAWQERRAAAPAQPPTRANSPVAV